MEIFAFVQVFWCPLIVHKVQRIEVVVVVLDVHAAVGAHRRVDTAWRYDQIPLVTFTGYPMRFIHQHRTDDDHPTVFFGELVGIIVGIVGVVAERHTVPELGTSSAPPVKSVFQRLHCPGLGGDVIKDKFLVTLSHVGQPHFLLAQQVHAIHLRGIYRVYQIDVARGKCLVDEAFELHGVFVAQVVEQLTGGGGGDCDRAIIVVGRFIVPPLQLDRSLGAKFQISGVSTCVTAMRIHRHRSEEPL